jgi:hypothetical protein
MKKSGLADSPFFSRDQVTGKSAAPPPKEPPAKKDATKGEKAVYLSDGGSVDEVAKRPVDRPTDQSIDQSSNRSTDRPIDPSTEQSTEGRSKGTEDVDDLGPVVDRPRAFYITAMVDRWLDEAVRYLKEKGLHKADRSVLVNALLHDPDLYKPPSLDKMRVKLLAHLTNKSLKRVQSTD